jgi:hypothetical protein
MPGQEPIRSADDARGEAGARVNPLAADEVERAVTPFSSASPWGRRSSDCARSSPPTGAGAPRR